MILLPPLQGGLLALRGIVTTRLDFLLRPATLLAARGAVAYLLLPGEAGGHGAPAVSVSAVTPLYITDESSLACNRKHQKALREAWV